MTVRGKSGQTWDLADSPLAEGGQAMVWLARPAHPPGTRWPMVLKLAHAGGRHHEAIAREAELLRWLGEQAPGLAPHLLDEVEHDGRYGVILERYPRDADAHVARLVAARRGLALEALLGFALAVVRQVARLHTVRAARGGRLIHRDLKPENLLVTEGGAPLLADLAGAAEVEDGQRATMPSPGTPVWAPYEQCLAEHPDPDPTWDTYACGVMLFWWITGVRPAYQDDPSPLLTPQGRAIHAAREQATDRAGWAHLRTLRTGVSEASLIDPRGHGAIQPADETALHVGVRRLSSPRRYGAAAQQDCARALARLLARCLSPLSHPSPPNRFWDAADLADELAAIRDALRQARRRRERGLLLGVGSAGAVVGGTLLGVGALLAFRPSVTLAPSAEILQDVLAPPALPLPPPPDPLDAARALPPVPLSLSGRQVWLDRLETPTAAWRECVAAGACPPPEIPDTDPAYVGFRDPAQPMVGVTRDEAAAYCAHRGGRLPRAQEWAAAAAKVPQPWDCSRAHLQGCPGAATTLPVYALPGSATEEGIAHLIGNAWEWTDSTIPIYGRNMLGLRRRKPSGIEYLLVGGAFDAAPEDVLLEPQSHVHAGQTATDLSFRCAYDAPPEAPTP